MFPPVSDAPPSDAPAGDGVTRATAMQRAIDAGESLTSIGKRYGISRQRVWQIVNPEKAHAQNSVSRTKRLVRANRCQSCQRRARCQSHHPDYRHRYRVIWLCPKCHAREHKMLAAPRRAALWALKMCERQRLRDTGAALRRSHAKAMYHARGLRAVGVLRGLAATLGRSPSYRELATAILGKQFTNQNGVVHLAAWLGRIANVLSAKNSNERRHG